MWYDQRIYILTIIYTIGFVFTAAKLNPFSPLCSNFSLLQQKGHGIPDSLAKEVRDITRSFFHLPFEEKLKVKMSAKTGYRFTHVFQIDLFS